MFATMAKKKSSDRHKGVKEGFYLPPDLRKALEAYLEEKERLDGKQSKTAVYVKGLEMFIVSKQFWPPSK